MLSFGSDVLLFNNCVQVHGFFSLTIGLLLCVRILCIYTIFICEQSFLVPIHGIIISSHIKTIEQSNATNNKNRYILKLMIGSWLQGYHTGETTLKLSRHTKVHGRDLRCKEICLMFCRGQLPRR